jgi:hypothetical protein
MFTLVENSTGSEKTVMVGWRGKAGSGRLGGTEGRLPTSQPPSQPRMKEISEVGIDTGKSVECTTQI